MHAKTELESFSLAKLKDIAKSARIAGVSKYTAALRGALIDKILAATASPHGDPGDGLASDLDNMTVSDNPHDCLQSCPQSCPRSEPQSCPQPPAPTGQTKRRLTPGEIDDIVLSIAASAAIPACVSASHVDRIRTRVRAQLAAVEVYPSVVPALKAEIVREYERARIQPGESVGIVTAQSIGERQTQMTLDTFHSAGAALKTVIAGVPRFSELLSATRNPKSVIATVYPVRACATVAETRVTLGCRLAGVTLGQLVVAHTVDREPGEWYAAHAAIYGARPGTRGRHHVSLDMDVARLFAHRIELADVAAAVEAACPDVCAVWSPTFLGELDVYFTETERDAETYARTVLVPLLGDVRVAGIAGVREVYYEQRDGAWAVETAGSDLAALLNFPGVDTARTVSNDLWEIVGVLGVEAARAFLVDEFGATVSSDGTYVNRCHIDLLVDAMTHDGGIMSVNRYGQRKSKSEPLARVSFEESLSNFLKAGLCTETESTRSVSAAVMLGKVASAGTGAFELRVDVGALSRVDVGVRDAVAKPQVKAAGVRRPLVGAVRECGDQPSAPNRLPPVPVGQKFKAGETYTF